MPMSGSTKTLCAGAALLAAAGLVAPAAAQSDPAPAPAEAGAAQQPAQQDDRAAAAESSPSGDTSADPLPWEAGASSEDESEPAAPAESATSNTPPPEPAPASTGNAPASSDGLDDIIPPTTVEPYKETIPVQVAEDPLPDLKKSPAAPAHGGIEEVVVTARRTQENLQDVPVAISVLSAEDLRKEAIDDAQDLQGKVPSLVIGPSGQQRNTETPTIRGQGATYGASPGVIIYFAEVPLPSDSVSNNQGGPGKFFDLGNLQVLKGSQGTLFGRNTTGGALLLDPKKPVNEFEGHLQAESTSLSGRGLEGVINIPMDDDRFLFRAGAKYFARDGFTHDVVTGKDYDSKNYWTGRLGLTFRPSDTVENYLLGYYSHSDDNGTGNVVEGINSEGFNRAILAIAGAPPLPLVPPQAQPGCLYFNANSGSMDCGQDIVAAQRARGNRHVQLGADPVDVLSTGGISDTFSWELSDDLTLRNIASWSFIEHQFRWDFDGSSAGLNDIRNADGENQSDTETWTEELQLQGKALDARLVYVVGGYYERSKPRGPQSQTAVAIFQPATMSYGTERYSYAPYAQGTYDFGGLRESLDGLKLTLGVRHTWDHSENFSDYQGYHAATIEDSALTYIVGLDYKLGETSLVYGKYSRGYKTGGFSSLAVNPNNYLFDAEFVTNYELGFKTDFEIGETPVRLNTALYYTDYDDLQKTSGDSYTPPNSPGSLPQFGGATYNVGKASIAGFEADATIQPTERLQLTASYAYTKAEYHEFDLFIGTLTPQRDCSGREIEGGNFADYSCIPYQFTPRNQFSLNAGYTLPLDERYGEVGLSATYSWIDKQYVAPASVPDAEPGAWLDAFGLVNLSASWDGIFNSRFGLQAYVTNALDEEYRISNSNVWNILYAQSSIYGEPRVFGLQLRYTWGP